MTSHDILIQIFLTLLCVATSITKPYGYRRTLAQRHYQMPWRFWFRRRLITPCPSERRFPAPSTGKSPTVTSAKPLSGVAPETPSHRIQPWQISLTNEVRRSYELTQMIMNPKLYGFTQQEAEQFPSRINDEIQMIDERNHCKRSLPKYTDFKLTELKDILDNSKCNGSQNTTDSSRNQNTSGPQNTVRDTPRTFTNKNGINITTNQSVINEHVAWAQGSHREMRNRDGSVTRIMQCLRRGQTTRNNNLQLCTECHAITILPENVFPRFVNEVICDPSENKCLSSGGNCIEGSLSLPFRRDTSNVGLQRLGEWTTYLQPIRTSCSCEILKASVLMYFV